MTFFSELRRRNVVRVAIAYVLIAWVLLQAADFGLDLIDAPNWVIQALFLVAAIGLPAILVFSWIFEVTPEGLKLDHEVDRSDSTTPQTGRKLDRVIIGVLVLVVVGLVADRFLLKPDGPAPSMSRDMSAPTAEKATDGQITDLSFADPGEDQNQGAYGDGLAEETSIAVLPFVNMSADPENEFFSDGVSEEILNVLARIPELKVAARTSSFAFKDNDATVSEIAGELGVNHVLEGSVRKAGNQVRVTAQLIQSSDGFHLWSETYDRELDDIFAIQDEIAGEIAAALRFSLAVDPAPDTNLTGTNSLEAYEHYLRGIARWHERTGDSLKAARAAFEAAIAIDPEFAKAYSGLAMTLAVWNGYLPGDRQGTQALARTQAERALELDPASFEAYGVLGHVANSDSGKAAEAERNYEEALRINPSFATAYQWYGRSQQQRGEHAQAQQLLDRAMSLDPLSRIIPTNLAWVLMASNDFERAGTLLEGVVQRFPDFPDGLASLMTLRSMEGKCDDVAELAQRQTALLNKTTNVSDRYVALCAADTPEATERILEEMLDWGAFEMFTPDSRHLTYDMDLWTIATQFGAYEAAEALLDGSIRNVWSTGELGWFRNDQRPGAQTFNCKESVQSLYREMNAPPQKLPCP